MATEQQKMQIKRRAESQVQIPILDMPKVPDRFKRHPEDRAAWMEMEAEQDRWRKTLGSQVAQAVSAAIAGGGTTVVGGGGGSSAGGVPQLEADLHAVYLMEQFW